jgi:hypothetical protein
LCRCIKTNFVVGLLLAVEILLMACNGQNPSGVYGFNAELLKIDRDRQVCLVKNLDMDNDLPKEFEIDCTGATLLEYQKEALLERSLADFSQGDIVTLDFFATEEMTFPLTIEQMQRKKNP